MKLNIIEEYRKKHSSGVNLFYFELSEDPAFDRLDDATKSMSFFGEHKLLVMSGAFVKKAVADRISAILKESALISDLTFLFVENGSEKELSAKNKELFKILSAGKNMTKVFDPLTGQKLAQWVKNEFEARDCSVAPDVLARLLVLAGRDSWALINEIEKLTAYKKRGEITITDIKVLIPEKIETNVFNFIDMLGAGDTKGALTLLYKELRGNSDGYQILGVMIYQLRNMLIIKDLVSRGLAAPEISKKAGLHPFIVRKTISQVGKFDLEKLRNLFRDLSLLDINCKNGNTDLDYGLNRFILSI